MRSEERNRQKGDLFALCRVFGFPIQQFAPFSVNSIAFILPFENLQTAFFEIFF